MAALSSLGRCSCAGLGPKCITLLGGFSPFSCLRCGLLATRCACSLSCIISTSIFGSLTGPFSTYPSGSFSL